MSGMRNFAGGRGRGPTWGGIIGSLAIAWGLEAGFAWSAEIDDARQLAVSGQYEAALEATDAQIEQGAFGENWPLLKAEMELTLGRYADARRTLEEGLKRSTWSVRLRRLARDAYRSTGESSRADELTAEITRLVEASPWRYTDAENLVTLGRLALELGADAAEVQERFFQRAKRNNPLHRLPVVAIGTLALDKHDYELAAEVFRAGVEAFPGDADIHFGLAAALRGSDPESAAKELQQTLALNPQHVPALLLQADRLIDGEEYAAAQAVLEKVLAVNTTQPEALAYRSAVAFLEGEEDRSRQLRDQALSTWKLNPQVDFIIGRELSQKYRFAEGSERQRQALELDEDYLPAMKQLAEDLLRLGREAEGWELAHAVFERDAYDVAMYNLIMLEEELDQFATIENEHFLIRMDAREAAIYGDRVRELLDRARRKLCEKYGLEIEEQVTVEIFPDPADFAVRTFGIPGVSGYLGVCFGQVITANSPASQSANPSNWEAVLWHEFAHVVTLTLTNNRMPRWLSEGISVYEERQEDPRWGERMNAQYRELILGGELTPIGELSAAFLNPKSGLHVQFAYYESSLVVEYIIDSFGFDSLRKILNDLGDGLTINDALERHLAPLEELDLGFQVFVDEQVQAFAPDVDWSTPDLDDLLADDNAADRLRTWADENPRNLPGLTLYADFLIQREEWSDAKVVLQKLIRLSPQQTGRESIFLKLADIHRRLGETSDERNVLSHYAGIAADAASAYLRLIELETAREQWSEVHLNAERLLAVNPLIPQPHRALAAAAEKRGAPAEEIRAYQSLLALAPDAPADIHFHLARLHRVEGRPEAAKRHVLQSLEEVPRYRAAHRLLLKIIESESSPADNAGGRP